MHYPYAYERGQRLAVDIRTRWATDGFAVHVLRTRETLVINENMAQQVGSVSAAPCCPARRWKNRR